MKFRQEQLKSMRKSTFSIYLKGAEVNLLGETTHTLFEAKPKKYVEEIFLGQTVFNQISRNAFTQ